MASRIKCPHCEKSLAGNGNLKRHIRTVHKSIKSE
ncbi:C2H2-type zinc finger protein [Nitrosarchaeum sp. AC2]|nr:C2H2-type zinc finger protein [Nitrosarchaeum sp. AC2]QLH11242.1 hypothetical protein DSQ20_07060 [Nitrosarchaeum sp. AC2]